MIYFVAKQLVTCSIWRFGCAVVKSRCRMVVARLQRQSMTNTTLQAAAITSMTGSTKNALFCADTVRKELLYVNRGGLCVSRLDKRLVGIATVPLPFTRLPAASRKNGNAAKAKVSLQVPLLSGADQGSNRQHCGCCWPSQVGNRQGGWTCVCAHIRMRFIQFSNSIRHS